VKKILSIFLSLTALALAQVVVTPPSSMTVGSVAGPGSGGGTGPYSPTTFTSNAVLLGNGTGAIQASGITSTAGGSGLTASA